MLGRANDQHVKEAEIELISASYDEPTDKRAYLASSADHLSGI